MTLTTEEFNKLLDQQYMMSMFMREMSQPEILLIAMRDRFPDLPFVSTEDVKFFCVSYDVGLPGALVTLYYDHVEVCFVGDRWVDIGEVIIRLNVGDRGRIVRERIQMEHQLKNPDGMLTASKMCSCNS